MTIVNAIRRERNSTDSSAPARSAASATRCQRRRATTVTDSRITPMIQIRRISLRGDPFLIFLKKADRALH